MRTIDVSGLEPDAVRVVERIVERLRFGQATYGPLDLRTNPRDWREEGSEELLDGSIYFAMKSLRPAVDDEIALLKRTIRDLEQVGDREGARAAATKFTAKVRERAGLNAAPAPQE